MKHYYISTEIDETMPNYDFVLKAENQDMADEEAVKIISGDYPDYIEHALRKMSVHEITAEQLLERLTIN